MSGESEEVTREELVDALDELAFRVGGLLMLHGAAGSRDHQAVRDVEESRDRASSLLARARAQGANHA